MKPTAESSAKTTRKNRARAAIPGTIAANPRIIVEDSPDLEAETGSIDKITSGIDVRDLFTADELSELPIVIRNSRVERTRVWRSGNGEWWRVGGRLRLQLDRRTGIRSLVVLLCRGANEDDLQWILRAANRTRATDLGALWDRIEASWADERTFTLGFCARPYGDPYTHRDASPEVVACDMDLCRDKWHHRNGVHVLDEIERNLPEKRGTYRLRVIHEGANDDAGNGWIVETYTDDFYGIADDVATFVNDLQWMQGECNRANAETSS